MLRALFTPHILILSGWPAGISSDPLSVQTRFLNTHALGGEPCLSASVHLFSDIFVSVIGKSQLLLARLRSLSVSPSVSR